MGLRSGLWAIPTDGFSFSEDLLWWIYLHPQSHWSLNPVDSDPDIIQEEILVDLGSHFHLNNIK